MTKTDRPKQEPRKCKHFDCWKCRVHHGKHPCMFASVFAGECDAFIRKYYPEAPHSILPDHFSRLAVLLPEYAGDCYNRHSKARKLAAESLLNEINKMEFYGDD